MKHLLENFAIKQCAGCGLELPKLSAEEDKQMRIEYALNFPNDPEMKEEIEILCDDCYKKTGLKA